MRILLVVLLIGISISPAFADTITCTKTTNGNSTVITCPNITSTQTIPAPYYTSPDASNPYFNDIVNTFFGKLNQATVQFSGSNAGQIQNFTNGLKQVVTTGIDFFYALKYIVAALLGLIVPRLFGVNVPPLLLPVIEWATLIIMGIAIWRHAWKIVLVSLIIAILFLLLFFAGGVLFH